MNTLHCALENGADLYVKKRQTIRHYHARSAEERRKDEEEWQIAIFFGNRYVAPFDLVRHCTNSPTMEEPMEARSDKGHHSSCFCD